MKIVLAGATGFLGSHLIRSLQKDAHKLFVLTRSPAKASSKYGADVVCIRWDAKNVGPWSDYIAHADAVVNLTGESLAAKRWNDRQKRILWDSRIDSTRVLVDAMRIGDKKPGVLLNASAVGYYGNVPSGDVTEQDPPAEDFLGKLSQAWEEEALRAADLGVRVVTPRIGIVLAKDGGALEKMVLPFKFFVGGPIGSGKQFFPWVHRDDVVGAFKFLMAGNLSGAVNLTAPNPVTMNEFSSALGRVLHRPSWARVPAFALRVIVGEFAQGLLGGQRAIPKKLMDHGFAFSHPTLDGALQNIFEK